MLINPKKNGWREISRTMLNMPAGKTTRWEPEDTERLHEQLRRDNQRALTEKTEDTDP